MSICFYFLYFNTLIKYYLKTEVINIFYALKKSKMIYIWQIIMLNIFEFSRQLNASENRLDKLTYTIYLDLTSTKPKISQSF